MDFFIKNKKKEKNPFLNIGQKVCKYKHVTEQLLGFILSLKVTFFIGTQLRGVKELFPLTLFFPSRAFQGSMVL